MSRKLLPITEKSQVYSFTYYSYLQAIIGNNYRIGNIAVVFHVADLNMSEWKLYSKKLTLDTVGKNIVLKTNRFNIGMNGMFYRELSSHDDVDVTILYQQYSRPWGNISLFVTDDDPEQENCRFNYKLGYFNCGEYYKKEKGTQEYLGSTNKNQNRFILKRDETKVYFIIRDFPSGEDIYTQEIMISDVSENSKWKAGIHIELEDNIYYYWFFSNYVQLKWKECELSLEFDLAVRRNWEYYIQYS